MNHFSYTYSHEYQCLIKSTPEGVEIQRMYLPFVDLERICVTLWHASADKLLLKGEEE